MHELSFHRIIDISMELDNGIEWYPGDTPFHREFTISAINNADDVCTVSSLSMSAHSGTHLDAPRHFVSSGTAIHEIPVSRFISKAAVIRCKTSGLIGREELSGIPLEPGMSLLLQTRSHGLNGTAQREAWPTLSLDGAEYLKEKKVNLVGIDAMSIESDLDLSYPVHRLLLGHEILILENLRLEHVTEGRYTLVVLPLPIRQGDGAPARAILLS